MWTCTIVQPACRALAMRLRQESRKRSDSSDDPIEGERNDPVRMTDVILKMQSDQCLGHGDPRLGSYALVAK